METISQEAFKAFCRNSAILKWKDNLPSIVRHDSNLITKIWDRRKRPSSDWVYPYYRRFCRNARKLISHGVVAPHVKHTGKVSGTHIHIVTYEELPGMSLKNVLTKNKDMLDVGGFAGFLAHLHNKGIYFQGLHLGNVLRLDSGSFGLIDVADVQFWMFPLNLNMRAKNLSRLLYYIKHRRLLEEYFEYIVHEYCAHLNMRSEASKGFSDRIQGHLAARQAKKKRFAPYRCRS